MNQALAQNIFDAYVRDAQTRARPVVDQQALNAVQASY
jgi:peptidyl-prolyl cis-trans isomerase D